MQKPLILVAEDNSILQKVIDILCQRIGVRADLVASGEEALSALELNPDYRLILMDWHLGDMDGITCTLRIRENERRSGRHIPIIAMTASVADDERRTCLNSGMDDFLSKPFTQEEFRSMLLRWLSPVKQQCS